MRKLLCLVEFLWDYVVIWVLYMDIYGVDRVVVKFYLCFIVIKVLVVFWFLIKWKIESVILINFKVNLNVMK